jgi:hypothetical protein
VTNGSEDECAGSRKKTILKIKLRRNKDGFPILPSLDEINSHDSEYKKRLIGKFIGDIYGS